MFLVFPDFNIFSTPLLVLVSQGVIFGILLLSRYSKRRIISDLFLGLLVLITCYHRTSYTIGFMDWYDTYRNTKVNYYLIYLGLAIGPLIYLYVRSVTTSDFRFKKKDLYHFLPVLLYFIYRIFILLYDVGQPGFADKQNGILMESLDMGYMGVFWEAVYIFQHLLYLAFTLQLFFQYKKQIQEYFSNTYRLELNWIKTFLYLHSFLFLYWVLQQFVDLSVFELSWIQRWWYQLISAMVIIYVGIKGYFTDTTTLHGLDFKPGNRQSVIKIKEQNTTAAHAVQEPGIEEQKLVVLNYLEKEKPYLDADLNLRDLALGLNMSRSQLSEVINMGFQKNFNDFINGYRVNAMKDKLAEGRHKQLSLLGIAFECGFNSKATFNRVFKKITNSSPTEYLKTLS
ncbi:helix-turn-helix domain-containing protein [Poritiphilus flavus]|uniref:Helix-turn-helix domain-containing protein n=1 Tax=Poritiphilus flavus TaxID=2697053 RepID=A0A6L9EEH5_9FLAO|nr:helix-turn-helix domain-containing protein [Poritiphilus flavus]NAS13126.1 helix-turn-helix domain-containing protein [Poritiphilus flavus]